MVWINELPWHELAVDDELALQCTDPFCRSLEWQFRSLLYQWDHLPADMIIDGWFPCPLAIRDTGFGIGQQGVNLAQDDRGGILSQHFEPQIRDFDDLEKIKLPELSRDDEATDQRFAALDELFGDLLPIRRTGVLTYWFAPWDELIRWWGVQDAMTDLALRPELVHAAMDRLVTAYLARLRQWRELNALDQTDGNYRVISGWLGYSSELPAAGFDPARVRTVDQWGNATAQIFSEVSPAMHEAFALQYERRWLQEFGLTYYGCCEPLHIKLDILASVPNLRKISMSPKADIGLTAAKVGDKYVLSHKPNPAIFADRWSPEQAREWLVKELDKARGCVVEVIMKDVSTLRNEPHRIWEWAQIAMEVAEQYA